MDEIESDVVIVGAGVCGLLASLKLARLGFRVVLVERSPTVAAGASSRNEGWLHAGTYHASAVTDRADAIQVARKCLYGFNQIRRLAPESIEWTNGPAVALTADRQRAREAESRWRTAGVGFQAVRRHELSRAAPSLDFREVYRAYFVEDLGFNSRILNLRLLADARHHGVLPILNHTFRFSSDGMASCVDNATGVAKSIRARWFILAAGLGTAQLVSQLRQNLRIRYWKSHIIFGPQLVDRPVFWLDPRKVAIMHHAGRIAVVGLTNDAYRVEAADGRVETERVELVLAALKRMVGTRVDLSSFTAYSCVKVDVDRGDEMLSVDAEFHQLRHDVVCVLPGKLTEAPFIADKAVYWICNDDNASSVAPVPWQSKDA